MRKHKTTGWLMAVVIAGICTVSFGDALLIDIYGNGTSGNAASSTDWSNAGIAEDVTGAAGGVFGGSILYQLNSLTLSGGANGQGGTSFFTDSSVLNGYQYTKDAVRSMSIGGFDDGAGNAVTLTTGTLAGLDGNTFTLQANQEYKLYLFGAGGADDQNTTFNFGGVDKTTSASIIGTASTAGHMVDYTFTTPGDLTDFSVDFTYEDVVQYGAFNGLAIVAIPEPATLGLVVAVGGGLLFIRRRIMI